MSFITSLINAISIAKRLRHPGRRLREQAQRLYLLELRLSRAMQRQRLQASQQLAALQKRLVLQSPDRLLAGRRQLAAAG
jgi:exodeoxyribonuclease VII large subunit